MNTSTMNQLWQLFPHFIVRTTGFPYELVERLRASEALALARQLSNARTLLQELREAAPPFRYPDRKSRACFRSGRPLPEKLEGDKDWIRSWNDVAGQAGILEQEYNQLWIREAEKLRAILLQTIADPRFQEAVASTSPGVYRDIISANGKTSRRLERQLTVYVQRLSTKNETISFFGPINYGNCESSGDQASVAITWSGPQALRSRRAHLASWLVRGLIDQIAFSSSVAPWLILQRRTFMQRQIVRSNKLQRFLDAIDGVTPLYGLCETLDLSIDTAIIFAREGCRARYITHQLEVPAVHEAPLENLIHRLSGLPTSVVATHMEVLRTIVTLVDSFSAADAAGKIRVFDELRQLVSTHYQIEGPSSAPQFYGDRQPVREECLGTLDLRLSGAIARDLETRVQPILELLASVATRTKKAANASVASLLGPRTLPLLQALVECANSPIPFDTTLTDAMAARISDPQVKEVHLENLHLPESASPAVTGAVCSVDLMIGAKGVHSWAQGNYEIVLSDVHDTALVWGWALQFHPNREQLQAEMSMLLSKLGGHLPVVNILASRRTGLPPAEFPGPIVELGGLCAHAHSWLLPVDDLWIESDGQEAQLVSRKLNSEVLLWNGELESLFHTAFSLPRIRPLGLSLGVHTPRLLYHGVVVQREQWQLETAVFSDIWKARSLADQMLIAAGIWDHYHLPERLFAKFPAERKPFYIDLANPQLLAFLGTKCQENQQVVLSEMRPQPQMFWLNSATGTHTAELRCTYVHMRDWL